MKTNEFEEFLRERHMEECPGTKDFLIEDFERWISNLDIDQWLNYGEWFGNLKTKQEAEKAIKRLQEIKI